MFLILARISKYNVGIKYNNIMDIGLGKKRKLSPDSNERLSNEIPSNERPSNERSISESLISPAKTQLFKYGRWEKWEDGEKVFYYNRPLRKSVRITPYQRFYTKYEKYNSSANSIDGINFAKGLITSILGEKEYEKAIEYVSDLLESYIFHEHEKKTDSNLTIRDILEINVLGTGHGGEDVATRKDINPRYVPDTVYNSGPSGILAWGSQIPISKEYALTQHYSGNKLLKRVDKTRFREHMCADYKRMKIKLDIEKSDIDASLIDLKNKKNEILSDFDENPEAKINVLGRISRPMACCSAEWREYYKEQTVNPKKVYTKKDVNDVEELFSMAQTFLNAKKMDIEEKLNDCRVGSDRSMTESFKCYDSTRLTDKRDIGQCIQTLSTETKYYEDLYANFSILFTVHTGEHEFDLMINEMLNIIQMDNNNLFENREGYKLNEGGFPFLMIKHLYKAFLNKSPDYRKISQGKSIYPAKLFDILGEIGKVSIYGSFCCRKGHRVGLDPYDSEGGRKKTRKRTWGNKRNCGKTRNNRVMKSH
jgi:hypothetical protein